MMMLFVNVFFLKYLCIFDTENMNRIKEILEIQGRSQTWLAGRIGKSYVITTNYCNNKAQPSVAILVKAAKALDVDVRELLVPTRKARF
jgi:transcriptional regulator with XRE-family HTH domain